MRTRLLSMILPLAALIAVTPGTASADRPEFEPGEVIVKFKAGSLPTDRTGALAALGTEVSEPIGTPRTRVIELDGSEPVGRAIAELEARPEVAWAEPNYTAHAARTPNDPSFRDRSLWGLRNTGQTVRQALGPGNVIPRAGLGGMDIGVTDAWSVTTGSSNVQIGIVDSGVARHEDLDANLRRGLARDFSSTWSEGDALADATGHGTHVAGTVGAVGNNGTGVTGVSWEVGLVPIRVLSSNRGRASDIAQGLAYAGQLGLRIVNISIVTPESRAIADAIRLAPRSLFVAAAGNNGIDVDATPALPCALPYENVICVAAIGNLGDRAYFSNYGRNTVDIGAPGNEILSTVPEFDYPVELPIEEDWEDEWSTGPGGQEWTRGGLEDEELVSPDPADMTPNSSSHVTSRVFETVGQRGCTWNGQYSLDRDGEAGTQPGVLLFERAIGQSWEQIGAAATQETGTRFEWALQADGSQRVRVRARFVVGDNPPAGSSGATLSDTYIRCLDPDVRDSYGRLSGTSMAAPHVAGVAGLMLARNPSLSTAELRRILTDTARRTSSLVGRTVTGGRLDAEAAVRAAAPPPPDPDPEPEPRPQLRTAFRPALYSFLAARGIAFDATSNRPAAITARAFVRWPGTAIRRGDRTGRLRPGMVRLHRLIGSNPAPWNSRARLAYPGRISTLLLRPNRRQLRFLVRVERLTGEPLRVTLAVRGYAPDTTPWPVMFRNYVLPREGSGPLPPWRTRRAR